MALTSQQIVTLALQQARCPGFTSQGGQNLNLILSELCQNYDFDLAKIIYTFNLAASAGPNNLPTDFLRMEKDDVLFTISGVPYVMINKGNAEYNWLVQTSGMSAYPEYYTIRFDSNGVNPPQMYVWPPSSGAYPASVVYYRQMPDITTPETSTTVPWFPDQNYLVTRLAGEMMKITNDDRIAGFLGEGFAGAQGILKRYLEMKDSSEDRAENVTLDRRYFGGDRNKLKNTKQIGW